MKIEPGTTTASPFNVEHRIGRIAAYVAGGRWLDLGCADGGYTAALRAAGASDVVGIDVVEDRVAEARRLHPGTEFYVYDGDRLPFSEGEFDGVLMNEVLEHVADEDRTLAEVRRVLRTSGYLVVISPNRQFPFEGHAVHIGRWTTRRPVPLVPWLPRALTDRWVTARNYWAGELRWTIERNGFDVLETGFVMPVFERYAWLPAPVVSRFREHISAAEHLPVVRRFGVSTLVVARSG